MLVLIDNANIYEIERLYSLYPYDGVTTNPSILMNEHKNPIKVLKSIREFLPRESQLHAQVISDTTEKMIEEAHFMLREIDEQLYIKVPVTAQGMRAIHLLKKEGCSCHGDGHLYGHAGFYGGQGRRALYGALCQPAG